MNKKIERILKIAASNGISLNKNFTLSFLSTHGFYEGPQALAESCVDEIERLCFVGMNSGFDNNLKSAIDKLSTVVINLTSVKNGDLRELSKLEVQRNKILDGVNKNAYPLKTDMRESVREYITSSVDAIDTILSLNSEGEIFSLVDKRQIQLMEESKKKLGELSMALLTVMDAGSLKAKDNAEKIIALLKDWRKDCSQFICTGSSVQKLDEAVAIAREWNAITVAPNKKEKIKDIPEYEKDDLTTIAKGRNVLETLSVFNSRIQSRLAEIDKMRDDLNKDKETVSTLKGELAGLEKKKVDVAREFKNTGDAVKANREMALIRQRAEELQSDIRSLEGNGRLLIRDKDLRARREITLNVKYICEMLMDNKSDLIFLAKVIDKVNFNALVGYMTGRASDINEANTSILQIKTRVEALRKTYMNNAEILRENEEITNAMLYEDLNLEEEQVDFNENGLDPELAKLLEDFDDNKVEESLDTDKTELRKIVPLGDDDK